MIHASQLVTVSLGLIQYINPSELDQRKLHSLKSIDTPLEETFSGYINPFTQGADEPIVLDNSRTPYSIINGRHRIYLAREQGLSEIKAYLQR